MPVLKYLTIVHHAHCSTNHEPTWPMEENTWLLRITDCKLEKEKVFSTFYLIGRMEEKKNE